MVMHVFVCGCGGCGCLDVQEDGVVCCVGCFGFASHDMWSLVGIGCVVLCMGMKIREWFCVR